jgi:hypothetical protein
VPIEHGVENLRQREAGEDPAPATVPEPPEARHEAEAARAITALVVGDDPADEARALIAAERELGAKAEERGRQIVRVERADRAPGRSGSSGSPLRGPEGQGRGR